MISESAMITILEELAKRSTKKTDVLMIAYPIGKQTKPKFAVKEAETLNKLMKL